MLGVHLAARRRSSRDRDGVFWNLGIDFLFRGPSIRGRSAGFLLLPLLLTVDGIAWLLMPICGALRARRSSEGD